MINIGLISDTHGFLDPAVFKHFEKCDEIWHAGDFGSLDLADELSEKKPLKGVYGNIDGGKVRVVYPLESRFEREGLKILMLHIGGRPGRYSREATQSITHETPDIFVCGHSHILKVEKDKAFNNRLYLNPGAAGHIGLHAVRTLIRFSMDNRQIKNMEVIELGKRGSRG